MNSNISRQNLTIIKSLSCKTFWYIFIAQALLIIYLVAPKECAPIITLSEDFIYLNGPNIIKEGETSTPYSVNVKEAFPKDINISLSYSGTAIENIDYTPIKNVILKKGELFSNFNLETLDDPYAEYNEELAIKIIAINGESFLNTFHISNPNNVIYTKILDEKNPKDKDSDTINIIIDGENLLYEDTKENLYTINLSHITIEDMDLNISYSGTATFGVDYKAPKSILIKKGQKSVNFTIELIDDIYKEDSETLEVSISGFNDIGYEDIRYEESTLIIEIKDELKPLKTFNIELHAEEKALETQIIKYILKTKQVLKDDISFMFYIDSTDLHTYNEEINVTMKKGTKEAHFELLVKDDNIIEKNQFIALDSYTIENNVYELVQLDTINSQTTIYDNTDKRENGAQLKLSLLHPTKIVYEDSKAFTVVLESSQTMLKDLKCLLKYSGSAKNKEDFIAPQYVTIKKGQNKATFSVTIVNDNIIENENIVILLSPKTKGGLEYIKETQALSLRLEDEINPSLTKTAIISFTGSTQIQEGEKAVYTLELSQELEADLIVNLSFNEHGAKEGEDFIAQKMMTIKKGLKKQTLSLEIVNNNIAENIESFQITLDSFQGGGLENMIVNEKKQKVMTSITDEVDILNEFKKIVEKQKILFEYAKDSIDSKSFTALDSIVKLLLKFPQTFVTIEGHTDSSGNKYRNQKLSKRRANSVTIYLIDKGIAKARLKSIGYGQSRPLVPDSNPDADKLNKRVGFKVEYKEKR